MQVLVKLTFESKERLHKVKLAQLVSTYLDSNDKLRELAFFWIFFLKWNELTGHGHLSTMAYLLMFITFLQKQFHLDKAQQKGLN